MGKRSEAARRPTALLLDDGELEEVRSLLDELGTDYARCGPDVDPVPLPRLLLVTTFDRARAGLPERAADGQRPLRVAMGERGSADDTRAIKGSAVDMLVYRPVHPGILRLLLRRALYEGQERRRETRVPLGHGVSYGARTVSPDPDRGRERITLERHEAILAELSVQGCRLMSGPDAPEPGTRISLEIPGAITGDSPLKLRGRIVRLDAGDAEEACIGVEFDEPSARAREELRAIVEARASGSGAAELDTEDDRALAGPDDESDFTERRRGPRVVYENEVVAMHGGVSVLLGRDLSREGLRVESHPLLATGERIRISIAVNEEGPLILGAVVARDDGPNGVAIRFEPLEAEDQARLDTLIRALPTVESVGPPEEEAILLTEVVLTDDAVDPTPA